MAKIRINLEGVTGASSIVKDAECTVGDVISRIRLTQGKTDSQIRSRNGINNRLVDLLSSIEQIEREMGMIYRAVYKGSERYLTTERTLQAMSRGVTGINFFVGVKSANAASFAGMVLEDVSAPFKLLKKEPGQEVKTEGTGIKTSFTLSKGRYEDKDVNKILTGKENKIKDYVYDRDTGQYSFPEFTKFPESNMTLLEGKAKIWISKCEMKKEGNAKYADGVINIKALTAEAHGSLAVGLCSLSEDGKRRWAPEIKAKIGASMSIFEADANGRVGWGDEHNMLGAYGVGSVAAGKAEAKAEGNVSFFNKDGELEINAYTSAKVEAIVAEAKGTAGLAILGVDAGVSGSVNIGVGAHAKAGIVDGKVKVDVGASLGIGFSVGFEVDVGGAIDAVWGGAKSVWNTMSGWFS